MRSALRFITVLTVLYVPLAAAKDLLPPEIAGLKSSTVERAMPGEVERFAGPDTPILREFGVTGAERRSYGEGAGSVLVTVYRFPDPANAYGAFSFLRSDAASWPGAAHSARPGRERVLLGNFILDAEGRGLRTHRAAIKELQAQILLVADSAPYPAIIQYFPTAGLLHGSERYVMGPASLFRLLPVDKADWVGFQRGAEAQLARYHVDGKELALLVISYPTPQAAKFKLAELGRWFNVNGTETAPTARPLVYVRRILSVLAIAAQTDSPEVANGVLAQVDYRPNFTWNEPGHRATDPPMLLLIYHMIIGIGILLAFALVAGISFGGIRIVVKIFFPGKVFDRPATMEILQLGLTSKPIEAKDFY
jgi:hypothetical protein